LNVLHHQTDYSFSRIVTSDEFWFLCWYLSDHVFIASTDEVIPREKDTLKA
jgi:hypothetical protein